MGQGDGGDGVDVVNPGALFVAANPHVVFGDEEFGDAVGERGECGHTCVLLVVVGKVCDFPDADFVVLVGGEEFVGVNYYGLDSTFSGNYNAVVVVGGGGGGGGGGWFLVLDEMGVVPGSDFSVGGACVEELAGKGEGGDVYGG